MALVVLAVALTGCTVFPTEEDEMSFKYVPEGDEDDFDQTLEITNEGLNAVAPTLKITPVDIGGDPVDGVTVTTAFGSDRGRQVVASYMTETEVLRFEGERAEDVVDVKVEIEKLEQVDYPEFDDYFKVQRFDDDVAVEQDKPFDTIELSNPNDKPMTMGLVLMAWEEAERNGLEQFAWSIPLDQVYTLPANGRGRFPMPEGLADEVVVTVVPFPAIGSDPRVAAADVGEWRVRAGRKREP
jgi:hypothetical protein